MVKITTEPTKKNNNKIIIYIVSELCTYLTHTRRTDALSLRGDVDENLDWNERPLYPHITAVKEQWDRLDTISTPGFGKKKRENRSLFLSTAYRWSVRGDMQTLTIKN